MRLKSLGRPRALAPIVPNTRGLRNDVSAALKELRVPVLRWPGGCFADEYHWRDGIGPRDKRPRRPNASWGGVDTNAFGTPSGTRSSQALT